MQQLKIITSTTREGRKGIAVARWFTELARQQDGYEVELLDLATINLPLMNEPNHPRLQQYQYEHTRQWSAAIDAADAFVIVLAEYNFGFPAPIKNAIDYLFKEWKYKPVGIVSYGGLSGGMRSAQMLKQVVTAVGMMPIAEAVALPSFAKQVDESGNFQPSEINNKSAVAMLQELRKWSEALQPMRKSK